MKVQTPTREQFDKWPLKDKLWWINYETNGNTGAPGTNGYIIYPDFGIRYSNDPRAGIANPITMSKSQAAREFEREKNELDTLIMSYN